MLIGLLLLIAGGLTAAYPYGAWYLSIGWRFKDAEPSDLALGVQRIGGGVGAIIGLIVLVSSCSSQIGTSTWEDRFKDRLTIEEVVSIEVGIRSSLLNEDDKAEVLRLIRDSEMDHSSNTDNFLSFYSTIELEFADGSRETIYALGGSRFQIEPTSRRNTSYYFNNSQLMSLVRRHTEP